jgi:membrane-associated phospholipid phosphatase/4-amino-4-deoxy-L-arabinose transferase-like glycosyltransferase
MHWLQALDVKLFHWVNPALSNPFLDVLMPFCSNNVLFVPALLALCLSMVIWGGARGRLCVAMLLLALALGDGIVCSSLKQLLHRPRPFCDVSDAHVPDSVGRTTSGSMPSSHAANWFAATMVAFIFYRRSLWFMLPAALLVSFSRVYNGVHYPGDVLVGAILGAGYAAGGVWTLDALWLWAGRRWFPLWWERLPRLMEPVPALIGSTAIRDEQQLAALKERQWLYLAYALLFFRLIFGLAYVGLSRLDLAEDEAYQWIWSKHPALAYYSKPPLIACTQLLGTTLWGDTVFGIRFFSPAISALVSFVTLRFLARTANARVAFWFCAIFMAVPFSAVGSTLLTIDPLSIMFWTFAMIAGWRAVQEDSRTSDWLWVGLWMGLGFLSKYTELLQFLCWAVFFVLWPPARRQLRRPGPYLALLIHFFCALPVLVWLVQHQWITVTHVASGGGFDRRWTPTPANLWYGFSRYTLEFLGGEALALNVFFLVPVVWAAIAFWPRKRENPLLLYLFSMGAPLFLTYFLLTLRSRVQVNWIVPSIIPLFCLAIVYWDQQWRTGFHSKKWLSFTIRFCLVAGLTVGCISVVLMYDLALLTRITGRPLSPMLDPSRRVSGWKETAMVVEAARQRLLAEGKPVFIIGGHYGITSEITFYLPEAKAGVPHHPLAYSQTTLKPENQFYYWTGYHDRKGQNAIFVQELGLNLDLPLSLGVPPIPDQIKQEFKSVTDLGAVMVHYRNQPIRRLQIVECRGLR